MATTSIWSIKNNLKQSINYIINPEKTLNKDYGNKEAYSYLEEPIKDYNFKEEKVCYVSCLNCDENNPCDDMEFTKEDLERKMEFLRIMLISHLKKEKLLQILLMRLELNLQKKCLKIMKWLLLHIKIQITFTTIS